MITVRWLGAAGLEFTWEGKTWLIDPYLSRVGKATIFFGRPRPDRERIRRYLENLPGKLQAVVVSHTHLDHALDVPEIFRQKPVMLVGGESLETLMSLYGLPGQVAVCDGRRRLELPGGAAVTMLPSRHGLIFLGRTPYAGEIEPGLELPLKAGDYRHGRVFIVRLEIGGKSFLHVGSANLNEEELAGQMCDVLFLCLPGWRGIPNYHRRILSLARPKFVVPFHFDDFSAPLSRDFRAPSLPGTGEKVFQARIVAAAPEAKIVRPELFRPMVF